ncbi:MAG: MFS transporter [Deltaproteobacteria bacterium]|nr:MFS transporter [Deltaproteobacteria bacterium]
MTSRPWVTRTVVGIIVATFFSDVGHEMVTAVLPLYLASIGLGPAALGAMEGAADLAFSLSKLAGGAVGHRVKKKRPWATAGYLATTLGTGAIALVHAFATVVSFRTVAWFGRGFRSPLRDFLLADEVGPTHFGRAYGLERSADMIGAVIGPLVAAALVWSGMDFKSVILWSLIPSAISVASIWAMTRDREVPTAEASPPVAPAATGGKLPRAYWLFVGGVLLFGLGDFSRTFLILLAASALGEQGGAAGVMSTAVLLYAAHNLVSAVAAYPAGKLGDARSKSKVLVAGYALGVLTNATLAFAAGSLSWLVVAITLSGVYIAIQETLEKAVVAELLPRSQRSLGLGILASANALGDFASSVFVGVMLASGHTTAAFAVPACVGALGVVWMWGLSRRGVVT